MKNKNVIIGAFVVLLALIGLGGYFMGMKSSRVTTGPDREASTVGQPGNSTLIDELKASLKDRPDDPETLQHLGDAYFDLKQFNEAVTYYKKTLEKKPNDAEIYNDIGLSVHYLGNSAEGLKYVEEGLKKNPYHQRIWLTKGFILAYGMGDLEGARAAWEKARTLNPESQIGKAASDFLAQFNKKK